MARMKRIAKVMATVRSIADCPRIKASVASEASAASSVVTLVFAHNALRIKNSSPTPGRADNYDMKRLFFLSCRNICNKLWDHALIISAGEWKLQKRIFSLWTTTAVSKKSMGSKMLTLDNHCRLTAWWCQSAHLTHCPKLPPVDQMLSKISKNLGSKMLNLGPMQLCVASSANKPSVWCFCGSPSIQHLKVN